jgi:oligopeptide transport system substrate-binding protein
VAGALLFFGACSQRKPAVIQKPATAQVQVTVAVPIIETRLVEKTMVVTATPVPTPAYVSRTNLEAGILGYPLANEPQTLDPQAATNDASRLVVAQLYEGLFSLDKDGAAVPAAASGYQASNDGKTYTVTLRTGLQWSDGQPVTAQQYVDGFCRALDPVLANDLAQQAARTAGISGAADYASGASGDCATVGIHATNAQSIRIDLEHPTGALLQLLAYPSWLPAPCAQAAGPSSTSALMLDPASFKGNGPYLLAAWQAGTRLALVKNAHYWDAAHVAIERVDLQFVAEPAGQLALYEGGSLHIASFPLTELPRIHAQPAFSQELQSLVRPGISYLGLNTLAGPTANADFRRAIASAIDRQALIRDGLRQPWHTPAHSFIPPGVAGYQAEDHAGYGYDPAATQKFLAQAGYGPANPPPAIELWTSREGNNPALMGVVADMLEKAGISTRLVTSSWDVYQASLGACNQPNRPAGCSYSVYWGGWVLDSADPGNLLSGVLGPRSSLQYTGWQSAHYEDLLARAVGESDAAKRGELYRAAEKVLLDDAVAVVPLLYYDQLLLIKHGVGFAYPPFGPAEFKSWTLP